MNEPAPNNSAQRERDAFSSRLRQALHSAGYSNARGSEVARLYLALSPQPVSPESIRKWLNAVAVPRQPHILFIAQWLNCDPAWLRFGGTESFANKNMEQSMGEVALHNDLAILNAHGKRLVRELISMLLHSEETQSDPDESSDREGDSSP